MSYEILVVDDEKDIRELVTDILEDENYLVRSVASSLEVFEALDDRLPDAIILDIWLQGSELDGLGILEIVKKKYPSIPVIMISGHGTIESAVNSIKLGAYDYIEKPFNEDKLLVLVKRACEVGKLKRENKELKTQVPGEHPLIGSSNKMQALKATIDKISQTASRVLITGESGTGKRLVANLLHKKSKRMTAPFIVFSANGLNDEIATKELLGYRGSGGINSSPRKSGLLEQAHQGTLYIDEIASLSPAIQNILLNFLYTSSIKRAGGKLVSLDVRVIASTSKDIKKLIEQGKFRSDLYYRINVVPVDLPPLAERKSDIPLLCNYYLSYLHEKCGFNKCTISEGAIAALQSYDWPGNVRQLRNVLEWVLIMNNLTQDSIIEAKLLPSDIVAVGPNKLSSESNVDMMSMSLRDAREVFECQYLTAQLKRFNGNITKMAEYIGMERSALHRKLKSLGICTNAAETK